MLFNLPVLALLYAASGRAYPRAEFENPFLDLKDSTIAVDSPVLPDENFQVALLDSNGLGANPFTSEGSIDGSQAVAIDNNVLITSDGM